MTDDNRLRLLDCIPDAVVLVRQDGRIEFPNAQTERVLGYEPRELTDLPLDVLIPERFRRQHARHLLAYFADPVFRPMETRGVKKLRRREKGGELRHFSQLAHYGLRPNGVPAPHRTVHTERKTGTQRIRCLRPDGVCPLNRGTDHRMVNATFTYSTPAGRPWISFSNPGSCISSSSRAGSTANNRKSSSNSGPRTECSKRNSARHASC